MFEKYILENFFYEEDINIKNQDLFLDDQIEYIKTCISNNTYFNHKIYTLLSCVFSYLVYKDLNYIQNFCEKLNIKKYNVYKTENKMVYGIFNLENGLTFLAFKGSSTLSDFLSDLNIKLKDLGPEIGRVHTGFYNYLKYNDNDINIFNNLKHFTSDKIFITGHSLGAALSLIFYKLYKQKIPGLCNINFGCPKVGDLNFCKDTYTTRVVNNFDIVTVIPFSCDYTHADLIQKLYNFKTIFFSIKQHNIKTYYFNIKKYIN